MGRHVLAHGLGVRTDLPIPLTLALTAAGAAVAFSFVGLSLFWSKPRYQGTSGIPLPETVSRLLAAPGAARMARVVGVVALAATLTVDAFGASTSAQNPAPTWFYVWFWVGLVPVSIAFGPVWRWLNPLRAVTAAVDRVWRRRIRPVPRALRYWPAAAGLFAFVWLELVAPNRDAPSTVLSFILVYCAVNLAASLRYGEQWYGYGDGFEVYSTILGHVSPLARRRDGRLILRNPLDGLAGLPREAGIVAVMCVLIGSTFFDGLTRTAWWSSLSRNATVSGGLALGTAGLVGMILAVTFFYVAASKWGDVAAAETPVEALSGLESQFVSSLVPISIGYTVAHYFSFLVYQGQAGLYLASDPFSKDWNLFGLTGRTIDYSVLSTATIALVQVGALVAGHVVGVAVAHDRAVSLFVGDDKKKSQLPMLLVMVLFTVAGITFLTSR